jgi:hypothetical protein
MSISVTMSVSISTTTTDDSQCLEAPDLDLPKLAPSCPSARARNRNSSSISTSCGNTIPGSRISVPAQYFSAAGVGPADNEDVREESRELVDENQSGNWRTTL